MYRTYKTLRAVGINEDEALSKSESEYIEKQATLWYAEKHALLATKNQVEQYIQKLLQDYEESAEHDAIESACKKLNVTFEETLQHDKPIYFTMCTLQNIYDAEYKKFKQDKRIFTEELTPAQQEEWTKLWKDFNEEILHSFKDSRDYSQLKNIADRSVEVLQLEDKNKSIKEIERIIFQRKI